MAWEMFQLFYSEDSKLVRGPRFRYAIEAIAHAERHHPGRCFAILEQSGEWYVNADGRSTFGDERANTAGLCIEQDCVPEELVDDPVTQPLASGSHQTGRRRAPSIATRPATEPEESTKTEWPCSDTDTPAS